MYIGNLLAIYFSKTNVRWFKDVSEFLRNSYLKVNHIMLLHMTLKSKSVYPEVSMQQVKSCYIHCTYFM